MKKSAAIFILVLFLSSIMAAARVEAKPDFAAQTKKDCTFCHPQGPPELGPAGLYFKEKGTLAGYGEVSVAETPTPAPSEPEEIGVHLPQWDVALIAFGLLSLVMLVTYLFRI